MENQKKLLVRVQLINWHYFENERIAINGSTLISGENTAGKSTILDAIQLVLTTNTRKFNVAANEKGNRNLKGYVRCKIGNIGETYLRKNTVPANVALEFYKFFDIIPKSLAFKPMDNVKEFINKFVLSEANVDIAPLRENIETLSELELLLQRCQSQLEAIERILKVSDQIEAKEQIKLVKEYLRALLKLEYRPITISELEILGSVEAIEEKNIIVDKLAVFQSKEAENLRKEQAMLLLEKDGLDQTISDLVKRQKVLEKKQLTYPKNTQLLKNAIEKEFIKRGIHTKVYILAELLEITDPKWVNTVEGYFHTQKFYLIVEPEYYDIALEVYEKNRKDNHTAGIINSKKIPLNEELNHQSLAYVVRSENRYAKAYSNYVLGRVMRCADVFESEKKVKLELLQLYLNTPYKLKELEGQLVKAKSELKEASKDPTLIQLNMQLDSKNKEKGELIKQKEALEKSNSKLEAQIENIEIDVQQQKEKLKTDEALLEQKADTDGVS